MPFANFGSALSGFFLSFFLYLSLSRQVGALGDALTSLSWGKYDLLNLSNVLGFSSVQFRDDTALCDELRGRGENFYSLKATLCCGSLTAIR
ncbi:hypothetical protein LOK49_Contig132G00002 [Camellia lanceoleosa]|nr:hypothetical protein LOK49_Contig132G00002 [Camellia lanceoleosa]